MRVEKQRNIFFGGGEKQRKKRKVLREIKTWREG
jgi:hypothetical protein